MATYKVIQDVEADEHLIWRLSLRQLVYALLGIGIVFAGYVVSGRLGGAALITAFILALPFFFLALPLGFDQPNDVWLLARLNFILKPKKRLWQQSGGSYRPLTITLAKDVSPLVNTKTLAESEVNTKIEHLSSLLDARSANHVLSPSDSQVSDWEKTHAKHAASLDALFCKLLSHRKNTSHQEASSFLQKAPRKTERSDTQSAPIPNMAQMQDFKIATLEQMVNQTKRS